jgi:hypothetical protein
VELSLFNMPEQKIITILFDEATSNRICKNTFCRFHNPNRHVLGIVFDEFSGEKYSSGTIIQGCNKTKGDSPRLRIVDYSLGYCNEYPPTANSSKKQ